MFTRKGFTLIEIMLVIAILGLLAAISIPVYQGYIQKASENSCLLEVKGYANQTYLALNDQDTSSNPSKPVISACKDITDASSWNLATINKNLIGIPRKNGSKSSQCDLNISASCKLVP